MKQFALLLMPLLASVCGAEPAGVTVTLTMPEPAALHIQYDVPPSCGELVFRNDGIAPSDALSMRAGWQSLDTCTRIDAMRMVRSHAPSTDGACASLRVRVPAVAADLDRVYPWAYPMGAGIYTHTGAFAVTDRCGPVRWQVAMPGGAVVADGRALAGGAGSAAPNSGKAASDGASDRAGALPATANAGMPLLLLPAPLPAGAQHYIDPALPAPLAARIAAISSRMERWLATALPGQPYPPHFTVASLAPARTWRGDVANRSMLRLTFPAQADLRADAEVPGFLAHEQAHLVQPAVFPGDGAEADLLKEGGAEFLRWSGEAQLGWRTSAELGEDLERAFHGCILATAGKPWRAGAARGRGRQPYDCGLAFHVLALAGRSAQAGSALAALDGYYSALRNGAASAMPECGAQAACPQQWSATLLRGDTALDAVLADYARQHPWLRPADGVPAGLERQLGFAAFGALMAGDCDGPGFFQNSEGPRIAYSRNCKTLRDGMRIVTVEGRPLVSDSSAAGALAAACRNRGKAALGLHDGAILEVACDSRVAPPPRFYQIDVALLLARLGIGVPPAGQRP